MTNDERRALAAVVLRAVADFVQNGGDLLGTLAPLVDTARGDLLTGDAGPLAIPTRKLDETARKRAALDYVRDRGRITSGELARLAWCDPETARLALRSLARRGVLVRHGVKRASHYLPGPQFPRAG